MSVVVISVHTYLPFSGFASCPLSLSLQSFVSFLSVLMVQAKNSSCPCFWCRHMGLPTGYFWLYSTRLH